MKKLLPYLFAITLSYTVAQVTNEGQPASWDFNTKSNIEAINLSLVDIQKIRAEDKINDKILAKPFRIGVPLSVNYSLANSGIWTQLSNGDRIWRILFNSKDAVHLSVNFDRFYLPEGAKIYLYNNEHTDLLGAYTHTQNNEQEVLGTWFVKGENLWVEYYEPASVKGKGKLNISSVIHGYRLGQTYQKGYLSIEKGLNDSGNCNHDVDCPIGNDFEAQKDILKKAVAFLNMGDGFICTGTLINNTAQDKTPYFLSANHCYERDGGGTANPALFSMRFNWISPNPVCASTANSTNVVENQTMSVATFRARNALSDFLLVEINNNIPANWDVTYAGWDRSDTNPTFEIGIHHPRGDIMKVSRDDTGAVKADTGEELVWLIGGLSDGIGTGGGWEIGVTEGGSSGSALFDQNGRIIGQLLGGEAACSANNTTSDNNDFDIYGRFATSWDAGGSASTQLKDWLDSGNLGMTTLDELQNVLATNDELLEQNLTLYPNPTSGLIQVKIADVSGDLKYDVYNLLGQNLQSNTLQKGEPIDLSTLPNSIYLLKITDIERSASLTKKIILNK